MDVLGEHPSLEQEDLLTATAVAAGVCIRPVLQEVVDTTTGQTSTVAISCGSTRAKKCPPCADKARRLRMTQCREGWHRTTEPDEPDDDGEVDEVDGLDAETLEPDDSDGETGSGRRVRSTRRRQDAPDLPRVPMTARTVGRQLTSPTGRTYRPSMFLTLTLPSYGLVRADGTPVDPDTYDYRRAALDAMHFSKLVDRFWQNLRRCAGYRVQYFSAVEEQRRLAPHLHAAVRGIIPRSVVLQVVAATYHQVWWPACDQPVYADRPPVWDEARGGYVDPGTGGLLPTWDQALDQVDDDATAGPAHVLRFGVQADYRWLIAGSPRTDRVVGYVTKYLTKSIAEAYDPDHTSPRQEAHVARLMGQVRWLPCAPECDNWLRYGIQPRGAAAGLTPGACGRAAHDPDNLGYGGRRVLVSRDWTSKTLAQHRADRSAVVRELLDQAGIDTEDADRYAVDRLDDQGRPRYVWQPLDPDRITLQTRRSALLASVRQRQRWRADYEQAKTLAAQQQGMHTPVASRPPAESGSEGCRSRGGGADHAVTRSALDRQTGDPTIPGREAATRTTESRYGTGAERRE